MRDVHFIEKLSSVLEQEKMIPLGSSQDLRRLFKKRAQGTFEAFLLEEGLISRPNLLKALSLVYQVPAFDVVGAFFEHELLLKFPQNFLINNCCIPLEVVNDELLVMIAARPDDESLYTQITQHVSYAIEYMVGIEADIIIAIHEFYEPPLTVADSFEHMDEEEQTQLEDIENIEKE